VKVILKSEVDNLGLPGDVVDVADGFGRNYLIPRGMAIIATAGAMKEAQALTRARKAREAKTLDSANASKQVLESRSLRIAARVDDRGHLYGSVSAIDVARVLKERGHDIPRKRIELKGTIKEIGTYEIPVHVHPQVTATVQLDVVDEEGKVIRQQGGGIAVELDEAEVAAAAADAAAGSDTDVEALKAQALEAAQEFEAQQAELEAEREAADATDPAATADADDEVATTDAEADADAEVTEEA
jgi:large subunit ribosomal protein L9